MAGADEDYRIVAKAKFEQWSDFRDKAFATQADYGKWLISSLFFMHSSAIAGLLFKSGGAVDPPPYLRAVPWFVGGLVLALGAGAAAWWNFTLVMNYYHKWAQPEMLIDKEHLPEAVSTRAIDLTMLLAIGCAALSVGAIVCGAVHIFCIAHSARPA